MILRLATLADLNACLELDHTAVTDHVWQMRLQEDEEQVRVRFEAVRLPRLMRVGYPRDLDQLVEDWQRGEGFFAAEVDGLVRGYADVLARPWQGAAQIVNLAVERDARRRGVGTALVQQARRWAVEQGLRTLLAEATTKNYPALCFYRQLGFRFCGFNDHYYANRDIALFFAQTLH